MASNNISQIELYVGAHTNFMVKAMISIWIEMDRKEKLDEHKDW